MNTGNTAPPPIPKRTWGIAAVTGAGAFMAMLDSTVVNLALQSIRIDLSSTLPIVQWVATGYLVALAASLPAVAWLGGRYGYGRVWATSLAVFVVASALCALAPGPFTLICARLVQGLAGGLMIPAGQAVIASTVAKGQLGRIFGLLGFVVALGPAIGPAVGGFLLEITSWRWLFWMNVPIGVAALIAARWLVPEGSRNSNRTLDKTGLALIGIGLPLLLYGATKTGLAETSLSSLSALLLGAVLAGTFVLTALRSHNPLLDLRLMNHKPFCVATLLTGLTGANMYGGILAIALYLQLIAGQSTTEAGLWLLVMGLGSAFALPVAGALIDRHGPGIIAMCGAGLLLVTIPPLLLPGESSSMVLGLALAVRGAGLALAQMPAMTAAYTSVTAKEMGDASALVNIIQRIGGAVGAAGVVCILQQTGGSSNPTAYIWALGSLMAISAITLILSGMIPRKPALQA